MSMRHVWGPHLSFSALLFVGLTTGTATAQAQDATVTGTITDQSTGLPIAGARVFVIGTNRTATANQAGVYTVHDVPPGEFKVRVLVVGYAPVELQTTVSPGREVSLDIALTPRLYALEEVVVTAQGEQFTREIGNVVEKLEVVDIVRDAPITNLQDLLNGRAPSVNVYQSNGTVGTGSRIRIRGQSSASLSNDPLIYVDGVRIEGGSPGLSNDVGVGGGTLSFFNEINPEDIESFEIVKGPSASTLYGTQAANGVIQITTKRGRAGPARWNFYVEQGMTRDVADYPDVYYSQGTDDATGATRACLPWQEVEGQCTITEVFSHNLFAIDSTSSLKAGYRQQYGGNVNGGTDAIRYYVAADWERETGTVTMPPSEANLLFEQRGVTELNPWEQEPNKLVRTNLRGNIDASLGTTADLSVSSGFVSSDIQMPQTGDNLKGIYTAALYGSANPAAPTVWGFVPPHQSMAHRVVRRNDRFMNSATLNWRPTHFITVRGTGGLDYLDYSDEAFNFAGQGCEICPGPESAGVRTLNKFNKSIWYGDFAATATYPLTSRIGAKTAIGVQYTEEHLVGTQNTGRLFPPGGRTIDAGAVRTSSELTVQTVTVGTYLEETINLDERLFVTGAIRYDRNSAFGRNSRAAWYPKGSASWVAHEDQGGVLGLVRARAAIGASGLQPDADAALRFLSPITATTFAGDEASVTIGGLGNPDLKPERSREIEAGADVGLFGGRINLEMTYYHKRTTDALVERPLPGSLGATLTRTENLAEVTNEGIEFGLNARVLDGASTQWDIGFFATGNRNRLVSLGEDVPPITGFGFANKESYPLFGLWWPVLKSFDDADGNRVITPDEVVTSDTAEFGGSSVPVRTATFTTTLSLFNNLFRISGLVDYRGGFVNLNVNNLFQCGFTQNCAALNLAPPDDLEEQAKAIAMASGTGAFGAYFEDASFVKFRELSVTFNMPRHWAAALRARTASLSVTGRNLALITGFNSWDPENVTQGSDAAVYNFGQAGSPRTFLVRLNLGF